MTKIGTNFPDHIIVLIHFVIATFYHKNQRQSSSEHHLPSGVDPSSPYSLKLWVIFLPSFPFPVLSAINRISSGRCPLPVPFTFDMPCEHQLLQALLCPMCHRNYRFLGYTRSYSRFYCLVHGDYAWPVYNNGYKLG